MHAANQFLWNANPHTLDGGSGMSEADPGACSLPCVFRIAAIRSVLTAAGTLWCRCVACFRSVAAADLAGSLLSAPAE